jgi:hypothetical protein
MTALFSPMPPVKTTASSRPIPTTNPAIAFDSRCTKTSTASFARSCPSAAAATTVRMSLPTPDSPEARCRRSAPE